MPLRSKELWAIKGRPELLRALCRGTWSSSPTSSDGPARMRGAAMGRKARELRFVGASSAEVERNGAVSVSAMAFLKSCSESDGDSDLAAWTWRLVCEHQP
jgi:hypothetical protein